MDKMIVTEDIFMKAAIRAHERLSGESLDINKFAFFAGQARQEMSDLCEKILALKDVGAL